MTASNSSSGKGIPLLVAVCLVGLIVGVYALLPGRPAAADGKLHILCTWLPVYVFTLNVVGDTPGVEVEMLVDRNVGCPHSYTINTADLKKTARADVVIANGLGSEPFLDELAKARRGLRVLTISDDCDALPLREEEVAQSEPAYEAEADHAHEHHGAHDDEKAHDGSHHHHHEGGMNPHVWVAPSQAAIQVRTLAAKLSDIDPAHAEQYAANAAAYIARLDKLHDRMREAARGFSNRHIVTFHEAFDYLARDLNLNVVATLTVVPEDSGSASQMARVVDTIKRTHAAAVFYEPAYSDRLARAVAEAAGVPVFPLNPFNTVADEPTARSYEDVMEENLKVLQQALTSAPAHR